MSENPAVSHRILVADDAPDIRLLIRYTLEAKGWQVVEAENGVEVLESLATGRFDVVLVDAFMPIMDGFEACRKIKADPLTRDVPVIFLTAQPGQPMMDEDLGALGCLYKPFNVDTLSDEILALMAA